MMARRGLNKFCGVVVVVAAILVARVATAEEALTVDEARELFAEGISLIDGQDFQEALHIFRRIQRVRPHPVVLYNLAWCLSRLDRNREALAAFESYMDQSEDDIPERIAEARIELARLRELVGPVDHVDTVEEPQAPLVETEDEPERSSRRRVHRGWFWSMFGLSAVTGITMAITGGLTLTTNNRWLDQGDPADRDSARVLQDVTDGLLITLGIEVLATLLIGIFTDFHPGPSEPDDAE